MFRKRNGQVDMSLANVTQRLKEINKQVQKGRYKRVIQPKRNYSALDVWDAVARRLSKENVVSFDTS